ncbi:hypothetical protein AX17_000217 [Amanita inopinata Kibby_2008]|nr:hypothetical protein AX17_000217 [Amanita inopinata Kibby_2008]
MSGRLFALFFLILSACFQSSFAEDEPCTVSGGGKYYDLNPLRNSNDYELKTSGGQLLVLNVCGGVHRDLFGFKDAQDPAGFIRRGHGDFSIGKINKNVTIVGTGPRLTLAEGSYCRTNSDEVIEQMRASTIIDFICDMSVFGTGKPRLVAQLPTDSENAVCAFYFEWKTHYACPTGRGGAAWGFFTSLAILILTVLMVYTILGTLYNRYVLQLRGFDQIPQFSIESMKYHAHEAADWFRDNMSSLYENSQRMGGSESGLPFRGAGGSANTPNPFSHFTQTSDENGFVRRQANRTESSRRPDINPISHQSQAHLSNPVGGVPSQLQSPRSPPQKDAHKFDKDINNSSTPEERRFMLEEEEEDLGQEMGDISSASSQPRPSVTKCRSDSNNAARDPGDGNMGLRP